MWELIEDFLNDFESLLARDLPQLMQAIVGVVQQLFVMEEELPRSLEPIDFPSHVCFSYAFGS